MRKTVLLGITISMIILGSTSLGFAEINVIENYNKITSETKGTDDGKIIGFEGDITVSWTPTETKTSGDLFGYKSTNMGDLDGNGAEDFATIAFHAANTGINESGDGSLLGNAYLILMNTDSTVKESHELSNCAAAQEQRSTRTFGESLDYLGVINGDHTLLISDYWFSKIHVLSIDPVDYTHTCSSITVDGLDDLGWPLTVSGNVAVDGDLSSVPDLIVGASVWDGIDEDIRYRDVVGMDLYRLDLEVDSSSKITATKQIIDNFLLDELWALRLFENVVVADIDGNSLTTDLVLGEPRTADELFTDGRTTGDTIHVANIANNKNFLVKVTTIEFENLNIAVNQTDSPHFGIGLANMGDLNNDGVDDIAVGIEFLDIGADASGGVAIMLLNSDGTIKKMFLIANDTAPYPLETRDDFGKGLEAIDVDGDGFAELVASAHQDDTGGTDAGAVYVLTFNQDTLNAVNYEMTPTPIVLNPTFDNYFTQIVNYAYADNPTPAFGLIPLPFTSTITHVDDVTTLQNIDFDVSEEPSDEPTFCNDLTIEELISSGKYTVFDNRDGSLGNKVKGTHGNDLMIASDNGDKLIGYGGDDCMIGGLGNDKLDGRGGHDEIYGNEGNDSILGRTGNDILFGNAGNDRLVGHKGNDIITGGAGNDKLYGGKNNDFLYGNQGNDSLVGEKGKDMCDGGIGTNKIKTCEL